MTADKIEYKVLDNVDTDTNNNGVAEDSPHTPVLLAGKCESAIESKAKHARYSGRDNVGGNKWQMKNERADIKQDEIDPRNKYAHETKPTSFFTYLLVLMPHYLYCTLLHKLIAPKRPDETAGSTVFSNIANHPMREGTEWFYDKMTGN